MADRPIPAVPSPGVLVASPAAVETKKPSAESHPRNWLPALDGVRGLAVFAVMLFHFSSVLDVHFRVQHLVASIAEFGWTGVDLFFVLSGFLITGILIETRSAENYFGSFFARRFLRIFPVYYLSLAVVFFALPILLGGGNDIAPPRHDVPWYFLYVQNWEVIFHPLTPAVLGAYWSLAIEEQFYLVWPLVILLCSRRRALQIILWGCLASLALRVALLVGGTPALVVDRITLTRMDTLLVGAACAFAVRHARTRALLERQTTWMWALPAITLMGLSLISRPMMVKGTFAISVGCTAIAVSFAGLLLSSVLTTGTRSILQRIFVHPAMRLLGKYSYAAYIWHRLVQIGIVRGEAHFLRAPLPPFLTMALMFAATLAVSACSYAIMEGPILRLKCYFVPKFAATGAGRVQAASL